MREDQEKGGENTNEESVEPSGEVPPEYYRGKLNGEIRDLCGLPMTYYCHLISYLKTEKRFYVITKTK